jgi:peptidyl-prolyl cis-trans isomerase A (cyclophilin A)
MKKTIYIFLIVFTSILMWGCSSSSTKKEEQQTDKNESTNSPKAKDDNQSFAAFIPSIVKIESFDKDRLLNSEIAFFVGKQEVVCRLSMLDNANGAKVIPFNENKVFTVSGFLAVDRINDLVLLKVEGTDRRPIPLYAEIAPVNTKSFYLTKPQSNTLPLHRGNVMGYSTIAGVKRYTVSNQFYSKSFGSPVFLSNGQCIWGIPKWSTMKPKGWLSLLFLFQHC